MFSLKSRTFQLLKPSQQEGWRGTRSWHRTQPGQLAQSGQRGIPYHVMSCPVYKLGGVGAEGIAAQGLTGCRSAGGEQLHCASFIRSNPFIITVVIIIISFFFSVLLKRSYLNPRVLLLFPVFSPIPLDGVGGVSERLRGA